MINRNDKNFYKVLTENYHEEEFRSFDIRDCIEYQQLMRQIRKLQKQMMEKYPDALDDLNELGDLYRSINEVKDHYFYEEGVMFAINLLMPRLISKESSNLAKVVAIILGSKHSETSGDPGESSNDGDEDEGNEEDDE